jgi:hypothetical protein
MFMHMVVFSVVARSMVMVTVSAVGSTFRLKGSAHVGEIGAKSAQHLLDNMVGADSKRAGMDFGGQVSVSEMPCQARKLIRILVANLDDLL